MRLTAMALTSALSVLAALPVAAADYSVGAIKVGDPWTRATPEASKVAGGFMTLTNTGAVPDTLIGGTAAISQRLEVHEMSMQDGVMRMRELKPGLILRPGETVTLKPGSFHIMLMDLKAVPKAGAPFKGTLVFEKAGTIEIEYAVEPFGTTVKGDGGKPMPNAAPAVQHAPGQHAPGMKH